MNNVVAEVCALWSETCTFLPVQVKKRGIAVQLIINTYGAYLSRKGTMFQIKVDGKTTEVAARRVQSILITTGVAFSTDAIQLAVESNIDILFLNKIRRSLRPRVARPARLHHSHPTPAICDSRDGGRIRAGPLVGGPKVREPDQSAYPDAGAAHAAVNGTHGGHRCAEGAPGTTECVVRDP